jgi:imidazolonepropionase-like amidohydrolase
VIRDGRIETISHGKSVRAPEGATDLDLAGRWLIPGLIDAHVHVATDPQGRDAGARGTLEHAFRAGITTVRDMGGDAIALADLARWSDSAAVAAPRVRFSGAVRGAGFLLRSPHDRVGAWRCAGRAAVAACSARHHRSARSDHVRAAATGATGIKIYADLLPAQVAAVTSEARRQHLPVWSHATIYPSRPSDAVSAGVDVLSHAMYLIWETLPVPASYHEGRTALRALEAPALDSVRLGRCSTGLREGRCLGCRRLSCHRVRIHSSEPRPKHHRGRCPNEPRSRLAMPL